MDKQNNDLLWEKNQRLEQAIGLMLNRAEKESESLREELEDIYVDCLRK